MAGGRGRGRGRGKQPDASTATATVGGQRACEGCDAAPGIPFCRVEWSFLCSSCGPAHHRNSWIVAVPPFPGPNSPIPPNITTSTDPSQPPPPPPYCFPPYMQMPPMQTPFQIPTPIYPANINPPTTGVKRRRRRTRFNSSSSKEQILGQAPADTDTDLDPDRMEDESGSAMQHSLKRKTRLAPPPGPTRADTGNVCTELLPGVEDTTTADVSESAEDGAQVDTMENIAAEMEPPPPELDELEQAIGAQEGQ